jgi:hypothetical protein
VRPLPNPELRTLNAICPYYTMFPLDFPLSWLGRAKQGEWVLDPFCGRGTTNYAARLLGLPSVGLDSNPVAAAIAAAKVISTTPEAVTRAAQVVLAGDLPQDVPEGPFWNWCFDRGTLRAICQIREALIDDCRSPARIGLRALMLGSLHGPLNRSKPSYLSNQMPRTYASKPTYAIGFWRDRNLRPPEVDVGSLVLRKAERYFRTMAPGVEACVRCADSRRASLGLLCPLVSWVVTSPPYYGMRTYVPDQWLRYWFLGGPSDVSYVASRQLSHFSPGDFANDLADVWENVATVCRPGTHLIIRFGGIRDRQEDPREILMESLEQADRGWRVVSICSAGEASRGRRQARQFIRELSSPVDEYDFHARLAA